MNSKSVRLKKKLFEANRSVVMDTDPSKLSYLLNLYEDSLNKQRYSKSKKTMASAAVAFQLSEWAQKGIK